MTPAQTQGYPALFWGTLTLGYEPVLAPYSAPAIVVVEVGKTVLEKAVTVLGTGALTVEITEDEADYFAMQTGESFVSFVVRDVATLEVLTVSDTNAVDAQQIFAPLVSACKPDTAGTHELIFQPQEPQFQTCCP